MIKQIPPITMFMIVSVGFHLVLMSLSGLSTIALPASSGRVFAVNISEQKSSMRKVKSLTAVKYTEIKTHQKKLNKTKNKPKILSHIKKITPRLEVLKKSTTENTQLKEQYKKTHTNVTSVAEKKQTESKARIVSILYHALNQHFIYPKLAQRHNWQGKVVLSLDITSSGHIINIHISHSSGYNVLDQAAIASLLKVGQLPQITSWLAYEIKLEIPIIYQLTES